MWIRDKTGQISVIGAIPCLIPSLVSQKGNELELRIIVGVSTFNGHCGPRMFRNAYPS